MQIRDLVQVFADQVQFLSIISSTFPTDQKTKFLPLTIL